MRKDDAMIPIRSIQALPSGATILHVETIQSPFPPEDWDFKTPFDPELVDCMVVSFVDKTICRKSYFSVEDGEYMGEA